jgi:hypothetical protein
MLFCTRLTVSIALKVACLKENERFSIFKNISQTKMVLSPEKSIFLSVVQPDRFHTLCTVQWKMNTGLVTLWISNRWRKRRRQPWAGGGGGTHKSPCWKWHGFKWFMKNAACKNLLSAGRYMNYSGDTTFCRACKHVCKRRIILGLGTAIYRVSVKSLGQPYTGCLWSPWDSYIRGVCEVLGTAIYRMSVKFLGQLYTGCLWSPWDSYIRDVCEVLGTAIYRMSVKSLGQLYTGCLWSPWDSYIPDVCEVLGTAIYGVSVKFLG